MKNNIRSLLVIGLVSVLAGCKLAVMVPSGGDVTSESGTRNCTGGTLCEHNITDSTFNESFTAVARPGYVFSKWNSGSGFLCANSTNPTCTISNVGTAGNAGIEAVIATGQFFYAMPLFDFVGIDTDGDGEKDHIDKDDDDDGLLDVHDYCPLEGPNTDDFGCLPNDDIRVADNRQWLQPSLFKNLSWNQINAVCPEGVCTGILNGYDVTGWTWATDEDMYSFFNFHVGSIVVGPDLPEIYSASGYTWYLNFWDAAWNSTEWGGGYGLIYAFTRSQSRCAEGGSYNSIAWHRPDQYNGYNDEIRTNKYYNCADVDRQYPSHGAWLYREKLAP